MGLQSILPGVPIIESPFFNDLASSQYFTEHEAQIAADLNLYGFAVLPKFYPNIERTAEQIKADLQPIFDDCKINGDKPKQGAWASRLQDAFKLSTTVKQIACDPNILALLQKLYGREAFAFQTLNFEQGSQQATHSDAVHFHSAPERFMCGVWVALEDVTLESGPLCYYPGSHKLPVYDCRQVGFTPEQSVDQTVYEPLWNKLIEANGLRKKVLIARAGDAFIWTANLLHGGEPILKEGAARWSQVTHYYFSGCDYFTPMQSDVSAGKIAKRTPLNIATHHIADSAQSRTVTQSKMQGTSVGVDTAPKTGLKFFSRLFGFKKKHAPIWIEVELPEDFDAQTYAHLNPDVIEAGFEPGQHYARHGYLEQRLYKATLPEDFDEVDYLALNPDVRQAGLSAKQHYALHGYREMRPYRQTTAID